MVFTTISFSFYEKQKNMKSKIISKVQNFFLIKIHERTFEKRLKYLYFNKYRKDSLLVLFTGFTKDDKKRRYNYVKGLKDVKSVDRLYVNDNFGYRGSYNLYENGKNEPELMTKRLIQKMIDKGHYPKLYFAGSSKGGTCAIYFGLEFGAKEIYAGACQYKIGTYLSKETRRRVLESMMGNMDREEAIETLDKIMPRVIEKHKGQDTKFGILYSKKDLTYERHIVDLMKQLTADGFQFEEKEAFFEDHNDVGGDFKKYLVAKFS